MRIYHHLVYVSQTLDDFLCFTIFIQVRLNSGKISFKKSQKGQKSRFLDSKSLIIMRPILQGKSRLGWNAFVIF